jgi:hypothetical protein
MGLDCYLKNCFREFHEAPYVFTVILQYFYSFIEVDAINRLTI